MQAIQKILQLKPKDDYKKLCHPDALWSSDVSGEDGAIYELDYGSWGGPSSPSIYYAFFVRCIAEL